MFQKGRNPSMKFGFAYPYGDARNFMVAFLDNIISTAVNRLYLRYTFLSTSLICNHTMGLVAALSSVQKIPVQPGSISEGRILGEDVEAVR
jgi:hypothetical protein